MLALIQSLSWQGLPQFAIAERIGIAERTLDRLKKKYPSLAAAIRKGREYVVAGAQAALIKNIEAGDTTSIIYALKIYGGDFFNDRVLRSQLNNGNANPTLRIVVEGVQNGCKPKQADNT
jgi:hypothetical protein